MQIAAEALFSAAVGQALDAKAQLMNHHPGWLQAITTLLKSDNTLVSSRTFTPAVDSLLSRDARRQGSVLRMADLTGRAPLRNGLPPSARKVDVFLFKSTGCRATGASVVEQLRCKQPCNVLIHSFTESGIHLGCQEIGRGSRQSSRPLQASSSSAGHQPHLGYAMAGNDHLFSSHSC